MKTISLLILIVIFSFGCVAHEQSRQGSAIQDSIDSPSQGAKTKRRRPEPREDPRQRPEHGLTGDERRGGEKEAERVRKKEAQRLALWNSTEIFVDKENVLIWQDAPVTKEDRKSYAEAEAYCFQLAFAGHKNWRVPSVEELTLLSVNFDQLKNVDRDYPDGFWDRGSSTEYPLCPIVDIRIGTIKSFVYICTDDFPVRCVTDGDWHN